MTFTIPMELTQKFLSMEGLKSHVKIHEFTGIGGIKNSVPGEPYYEISLDLSNYPEALKACIKWTNIIQTYFQTSYKAYRVNIGPYDGLYPIEIDNNIVKFRVAEVYANRKDWRDWFIKGDRTIAPV